VVVVVERLDGPPLGPLGHRDHALGLCGIPGERLLAEHVEARLERRDGPPGVQRGRQRVVHQVEVRVSEQLCIGVVGPLDAEAVSVSLRAAAGGDGGDDDVVAAKCGPQQRRRGDAGGAEDADDRWHQAPPDVVSDD
jgi:hypothetical protein